MDSPGRNLVHAANAPLVLARDGERHARTPLHQRKKLLRKTIRKSARRTFFVDHIVGKGKLMYQQICDMDMEGIVAKPLMSPYRELGGQTTWIKVKNPKYSQAEGRRALFNQRRG